MISRSNHAEVRSLPRAFTGWCLRSCFSLTVSNVSRPWIGIVLREKQKNYRCFLFDRGICEKEPPLRVFRALVGAEPAWSCSSMGKQGTSRSQTTCFGKAQEPKNKRKSSVTHCRRNFSWTCYRSSISWDILSKFQPFIPNVHSSAYPSTTPPILSQSIYSCIQTYTNLWNIISGFQLSHPHHLFASHPRHMEVVV